MDLLGRCEYSNRTQLCTKQPYQDPAEELVSVRFQTNSGTVCLKCEYDPTSIRPNCRNHAPKQTARTCRAAVCVSFTCFLNNNASKCMQIMSFRDHGAQQRDVSALNRLKLAAKVTMNMLGENSHSF